MSSFNKGSGRRREDERERERERERVHPLLRLKILLV
jgi:hypothetical protein